MVRAASESIGRAAAARFLAVLRSADRPLDARALKHALIAQGEPAAVVDAAWRRAQPVLRRDPDVVFDSHRGVYHHAGPDAAIPPLDPAEALELLLPNRITGRRAGLADRVRGALADRNRLQSELDDLEAERAGLEARLRAGYTEGRDQRSAQVRQVRLDVVRVLVDVVSEVEELTAAGAEPDVVAERIRGLAQAFGLRAIGRPGERTAFRPELHTPIGTWPSDEEPVVILRPGYTWHDGAEVVLVTTAQVAAFVHSGGSGDGDGGA
jgi:hypothetical protein